MEREIIIQLPWGGSLRCGEGDEHRWGGYVCVCDVDGEEIPGCYWDKQEWADEPELVMGAIFGATQVKVELIPQTS